MHNKIQNGQIKNEMQKEKYYFFLNPYLGYAFTQCPKCRTLTKIRKYWLVIHIEPRYWISLKKTCRYCPNCELIIVKKQDLEHILCGICEQNFPHIIGNDYFIYGTMDRKDWVKSQNNKVYVKQIINNVYPFKDLWSFEVIPAKWVPNPRKDRKVKTLI